MPAMPRDVSELDIYRFVSRAGKTETAAAGRCSRRATRMGLLVAVLAVRCQRSLLEREIPVWHLDERREMEQLAG
jgi:hypothetical protein